MILQLWLQLQLVSSAHHIRFFFDHFSLLLLKFVTHSCLPASTASDCTMATAPSLPFSRDQFTSYHCICSQLLFTSSTPLGQLERRQGQGLDKAYILHLPPLPSHGGGEDSDDEGGRGKGGASNDDVASSNGRPSPSRQLPTSQRRSDSPTDQQQQQSVPHPESEPKDPCAGHFAFSLLHIETIPQIVIRPDGFEKRYWARCQRCNIIVGYALDWIQFRAGEGEGLSGMSSSHADLADGEQHPMDGIRSRLLYIIPGGVVSTDDMMNEKRTDEEGWTVANGVAVPAEGSSLSG